MEHPTNDRAGVAGVSGTRTTKASKYKSSNPHPKPFSLRGRRAFFLPTYQPEHTVLPDCRLIILCPDRLVIGIKADIIEIISN